MDQSTRNTLRNVVTQCRRLLEESVAQVLQGQFGIYAAGKKDEVQIEPDARMSHLPEEDRAYRQDLLDHYEHIKALGYKPKDALAQLIREVAFTHLNRFCAYRMMESRGLIRESVSKGLKSQGFLFYLADHQEDERRFNTGQQDVAYRHFLNWLGGTLSEEIGVLFAPTDPANRLYPPQRVIDQVLGLVNAPELAGIWSEDEAIGWVYQYFTPKELRDQARKESQAPRNSYELAFRNQFFTPRYVVEFLTDNTLGRIWYEMRRGDTRLKAQCRYMVRRPTEVFLKDGQAEPKDAATATEDLSQEELLKLPVYVSFRAKKDPRELRILDPACGSGHFLLYCFDLLLTIYEEAYGDPDLGPALKKDYPSLDDLRRDVPRLILAHNLHGIDIDLRASQIAALALWLRCQRAYQEMGIKQDRPKIARSNFVCAEPMPGEERMLKEFVAQLEPKVLGQVVEVVFDKMKLAGEVGSLLKIEEDIRSAIREAKRQYEAGGLSIQRPLFDRPTKPAVKVFSVKDISDTQFFESAEGQVIDALRSYAERARNDQRLQRRLFSEDAVRGFAFVDLCHRRYDVVLMNPPFGLGLRLHYQWLQDAYPDSYVDVFASFLSRAAELCTGKVGVISSRSILMTKKLQRVRANLLVSGMEILADLGSPVMDGAMVQSCAYAFDPKGRPASSVLLAVDRRNQPDKGEFTLNDTPTAVRAVARSAFASLPQQKILYLLPQRILSLLKSSVRVGNHVLIAKLGMKSFDDFRFLRLRAEVAPEMIGRNAIWEPLSKGGPYARFYSDLPLLIRWNQDGEEIAQENIRANGQTAQARQASKHYRRSGGTYSRRAKDFGVRMLPAGCIIGEKGPAIFSQSGYSNEFVIGFLNSRLANCLVHVQANAKQFDSGIVEGLPWQQFTDEHVRRVEELVTRSIKVARIPSLFSETESLFVAIPTGMSLASLQGHWNAEIVKCRTAIREALGEINEIVDSEYGIDSNTLRQAIDLDEAEGEDEDEEADSDDANDEQPSYINEVPEHAPAIAVLSYCVGVVAGRWDIRLFLNNITQERIPDLFHETPRCQPGLLQDLDAAPHKQQPRDYPLRIDLDGILPDDPDHADDIVCRVREAFEVIWNNRAESIEKEAGELLGVKSLRDFFRKPGKGGFWDDHISRYSKSRRKAPIYWLLQSSKKNYAIWLYYHRLDKDILFKALVNYVEPKIRLETDRLESLRAQKGEGGTGKATKKLDKEIEKQEDFLSELRDFEEKLRRAAELHLVPDLNDGVVLNIAPLHELVPWSEAEKYWEELLEGKYEWSSIGKQLREKGLVK